MNVLGAVGGGLAGACALTLLHESARHLLPNAPRMPVLGERALSQAAQAFGGNAPSADQLHDVALGGDALANGLYYGLVALGPPEHALLRGALLGLVAGLGGVLLPGPFGLGREPGDRASAAQAMTIAWYVAGGLAAGAAYQLLAGDCSDEITSSEL